MEHTRRIEVNDRIHLSEICSTDIPSFVKHLKDKEIYDRTFYIPYPYSEKDAEWFLQKTSQETSGRHDGHPVTLAIRLTSNTSEEDELIGCVGLTDFAVLADRPATKSAELGYWLAKPYWGQGIMTAVIRSMVHEVAVMQCNLEQVVAKVYCTNDVSARVLEKNGFVFQAVLRQHVEKDGAMKDVKLYTWKTGAG